MPRKRPCSTCDGWCYAENDGGQCRRCYARDHHVTKKQCKNCRRIFTREEGEKQRDYRRRKACSRTCARAMMAKAKRKKTMPKRCLICGESFKRRRDERMVFFRRRKTCSKACALYVHGAASAKFREQHPELTCGDCGGWLEGARCAPCSERRRRAREQVKPRPGFAFCYPGFVLPLPKVRRFRVPEFDPEQDRVEEFWECYGGARL